MAWLLIGLILSLVVLVGMVDIWSLALTVDPLWLWLLLTLLVAAGAWRWFSLATRNRRGPKAD